MIFLSVHRAPALSKDTGPFASRWCRSEDCLERPRHRSPQPRHQEKRESPFLTSGPRFEKIHVRFGDEVRLCSNIPTSSASHVSLWSIKWLYPGRSPFEGYSLKKWMVVDVDFGLEQERSMITKRSAFSHLREIQLATTVFGIWLGVLLPLSINT